MRKAVAAECIAAAKLTKGASDMNPRIRFCLAIAYALAAPIALFYAWIFERLLEPSLPIIPLAMALLGCMSAGASGFQIAELFADMESSKP